MNTTLKSFSISIVGAGLWFAACAAIAGPIAASDFTAAATTTTFDGLGLPTFNNAAPYTIDGNTYNTNDGIFRYLGPGFCPGECFATNVDSGYVDIALGAPALLVGLFVGPGANDPTAVGDFWSASVEFFNASDSSLGSVAVSGGAPAALAFAGWSDPLGIARIRITDTSANGLVTLINDVTVEGAAQVPAPGTLGLLGTGLVALGLRQRRRRG